MNCGAWRSRVSDLLIQLNRINVGYSMGLNVLNNKASAKSVRESIIRCGLQENKSLFAFYTVCDGFSWPDVHNGYFIESHANLGIKSDLRVPDRIVGNFSCDIITVGSCGGGALFAIRSDNHSILKLNNGTILDGTFHSSSTNVDIIALDWEIFLEHLLIDLKAFVDNSTEHNFLC